LIAKPLVLAQQECEPFFDGCLVRFERAQVEKAATPEDDDDQGNGHERGDDQRDAQASGAR
jgi:hypothetical protein